MGNPKRRIAALDMGVMVSGAKIPNGWAGGLSQYAADHRKTRAALVRDVLADWLKKNQQYTSIQHAAECNNRSYGQQFRQIMEDELPHVCPPIQEYRGNGAAWSKAIREGRAKRKMVPTHVVTLPAHISQLFHRIAKAKPETYPSTDAVIEDILIRWGTKQLERIEGGGSNPPTTQHA